jgi:hypothetical protein
MTKSIRLNTNVDRLLRFLTDLLRNIAEKDDAQIIQIAKEAQRLESCVFLVRGMCASVLRQRYPNRLPGGRGNHDHQGRGVRSQMTRLAEQLGIDRRTLETDARIKDTFFQVIDETKLDHIPSLAREYYVVALAAPEPQAAIKVAVEKRADPHYTLEVFRSYVRNLKRNVATVIHDSEAKPVTTLRVVIPIQAQQALLELIKFNGQSREEVVAEAIINLHQAVFRKRNSKRKSESTQLTLAI